MLIVVGALWFPLAQLTLSQLQHAAQQGVIYGAQQDPPCPAALTAAEAVLGHASGPGSTCEVITGSPDMVRVVLVDQLPVPPLINFATDGTLSTEAQAVITPP